MHVLTTPERAQLSQLLEQREFFWLDLSSPSSSDVDLLSELLELHPIVVEDIRHFGQRPKLDTYQHYAAMTFYGVGGGRKGPELHEVHVLLSNSYLVTIHREQQPELDRLRKRVTETAPPGGERELLYLVLDALSDSFFSVLAQFDDEIDELEDAVISAPTDEQLQRIFKLKRSLVTLRKIVTPQRDMLTRAIDLFTELPGQTPDTERYFRDIYDHMIRISDLIDSYRDLLSGALDVYLSTVSNRLNDIMKRLTIIATIFLPLTFVTGFFGQNFEWMVEKVSSLEAFLILGGGSLILSILALIAWFKRSRFI